MVRSTPRGRIWHSTSPRRQCPLPSIGRRCRMGLVSLCSTMVAWDSRPEERITSLIKLPGTRRKNWMPPLPHDRTTWPRPSSIQLTKPPPPSWRASMRIVPSLARERRGNLPWTTLLWPTMCFLRNMVQSSPEPTRRRFHHGSALRLIPFRTTK